MSAASPTNDRREVLWNLVLQYAGIAFMLVQGVVLVPIYLRYLGSAEFGVWLVAGGVATWLAVVDPGISALMQQRVARALGSARPGAAARLARRGLRLNAALAALMLLAGAAGAAWIARLIDPGAAVPARTGGWLVFLAVAGVAAGLMANALTALGVALRAAQAHTIAAVASAALGLTATLAGLALGWGVLALPGGVLARGGVQLLAAWLLVRGQLAALDADARELPATEENSYGRETLTWSAVEKLAGTVATTADLFLVGRVFDSARVTSYALTRRPVDMLSALLLRSSGALIPTLSYLAGKRADEELTALVARSCSRILWLLGVACLGTVLFLEPIMDVWVGQLHYLGDEIAAVLALTLGVQVFAGAFLNFLWAGVSPQVFLKLSTLINVLVALGTLAGLLWHGVLGMLIGSLIPRVLLGLWLAPKLAWAALHVAPSGRAVIRRELLHALAAVAVGLAVFWGLGRAWPGSLAAAFTALAVALAALVLASGQLRGELRALGAALRAKRVPHP